MISHTYRGHVVVRHAEDNHEVEALGKSFRDEASAHAAVDAALKGWVESYDSAAPKDVDTAR